ncbi:MAG: peptidyl-prolyl cis-trans isomerase [Eubacterium sp.]|nr:peptidyl-prolyl cis-trans isomerase [Eubacterium sp.]
MRKMKIIAFLMAAVLLVASVVGCSGGASSTSAVFKIGKEKCSMTEAKILLVNYQNQYRDVYGVDLWKATENDNQELESYIKDLTISQLAEIYMMAYIGEDQDMELTDVELEHVQAAAAAYYGSLNDAEKDYFGASEKDMEALYEKYAMARKVFATLTQNVSQEVSDDDARVMSVMQIYTEDKATATTAYNKVKSGSEFSAVAATYDESGTINTTVDRLSVPAEAEDAVFDLSNEEYTPVLETADGYYIYYCVNNYEESLTEENKEKVLAARMEEAVASTYETYAASTDSRMYADAWEQVKVNTDEALTTITFFDVFEEYCGADY